MTASSKPRASTPRPRCRVGDIVVRAHGWPPYVVLSIERGHAVLGVYRGPGSVSAPATTELTSVVRSWIHIGRCEPDSTSLSADRHIIRPTDDTPSQKTVDDALRSLTPLGQAVQDGYRSMPRVSWQGGISDSHVGIALHVDPRGSLGETVTVLWDTGTVSNVPARDLELIPERNDP